MRQKFFCARFYVTHECNSFCKFCDTHSAVYRDIKPLPLESAKSLVKQLYDIGCRYLDITGGEPSLNPNLPEILKYAAGLGMGIKTEVTTNGISGMTETLKQCAELAVKFNISLDTVNREIYRNMRGVDKLSTVIKTVREAVIIRKNKGLLAPRIMTVLTDENACGLPEMVRFAQNKGTEIYINPVFHYVNGTSQTDTKCLDVIRSYVFEKNTVVMLHFLEFYGDYGQSPRPLCSACRQTLTIAADGRMIVPCYHARGRKFIRHNGNIKDITDSEEFIYFHNNSGTFQQCSQCTVSPYFGISFSYSLNKYFLLQSFSERLARFKRSFMNVLPLRNVPENLHSQLNELIDIVRSLNGQRNDVLCPPEVYRKHRPSCDVSDCWELERVPHRMFDAVFSDVYQEVERGKHYDYIDILENAPEFMLRWWKLHISVNMNVSVTCNFDDERKWLREYFRRLGDFRRTILRRR